MPNPAIPTSNVNSGIMNLAVPLDGEFVAAFDADRESGTLVVMVSVRSGIVVPGMVVAGFVIPGATVLPLTRLGASVTPATVVGATVVPGILVV